jgi:basic amino acid/polyamine antiporter, APA family
MYYLNTRFDKTTITVRIYKMSLFRKKSIAAILQESERKGAALMAFFAGVIPLGKLAELTNIGTLFAFIVVSLGVLVLRKTQPNLKRAFKVSFVPVIPILAILFCGYLALQLPATTWTTFVIWITIGLVVYFLYGRRNSRLNNSEENEKQSVYH